MICVTFTKLLGKLKSMTRLEKAKWLKRAKKELVKRFGTTLDGDADSDKVGGRTKNREKREIKKKRKDRRKEIKKGKNTKNKDRERYETKI